jgi:pimeloyl-ACP methyl ester carboxylesterase
MVHADPLMVLVHSPFLGPSAWEWVARELDRRGRSAVVAALRGVAEEPYRPWRDVREAVDAVPARGAQTVVLVGHSGAGSLLPAIAESVSRRVAAVVFVDAFLPPPSGSTRLVPVEFAAELSALATDDVLPPWSRWFGEDVMRDLVPDAARRARVEHDMPRLPLSVSLRDSSIWATMGPRWRPNRRLVRW